MVSSFRDSLPGLRVIVIQRGHQLGTDIESKQRLHREGGGGGGGEMSTWIT